MEAAMSLPDASHSETKPVQVVSLPEPAFKTGDIVQTPIAVMVVKRFNYVRSESGTSYKIVYRCCPLNKDGKTPHAKAWAAKYSSLTRRYEEKELKPFPQSKLPRIPILDIRALIYYTTDTHSGAAWKYIATTHEKRMYLIDSLPPEVRYCGYFYEHRKDSRFQMTPDYAARHYFFLLQQDGKIDKNDTLTEGEIDACFIE